AQVGRAERLRPKNHYVRGQAVLVGKAVEGARTCRSRRKRGGGAQDTVPDDDTIAENQNCFVELEIGDVEFAIAQKQVLDGSIALHFYVAGIAAGRRAGEEIETLDVNVGGVVGSVSDQSRVPCTMRHCQSLA